MSSAHANVVWQSPDGTWNQAFWLVIEPEPGDEYEHDDVDQEDEDDEHEVEYGDGYAMVTTGHPDEESAWQTAVRDDPWRANPGGSHRLTLTNSTEAERAELDALVATCANHVPYASTGR